jgi:hypothetical protein
VCVALYRPQFDQSKENLDRLDDAHNPIYVKEEIPMPQSNLMTNAAGSSTSI